VPTARQGRRRGHRRHGRPIRSARLAHLQALAAAEADANLLVLVLELVDLALRERSQQRAQLLQIDVHGTHGARA
jgi:hypothetical protein